MSKNLYNILNTKLDSGELLELVDNSLSNTDVLAKLGFSSKGQYVGIVKQYLLDNDVDVGHFTTNGLPKVNKITKICLCCGAAFLCLPRKTKEQVVCSRSCSNTYFRSGENNGNFLNASSTYRNRAIKEYGCACQRCGYSEHEAAIVVHHKDHNRTNGGLTNLEVLCSNCHAIHHWSK